MKKTTSKQRLNSLIKDLHDRNKLQLGLLILEEMLKDSATRYRDAAFEALEAEQNGGPRNIIYPGYYIEVADVILTKLKQD